MPNIMIKKKKSRFFNGRFLTTNCKIIQIKIRSMLFWGSVLPQRFLGGCRTRLPPCRHGAQGSEHPYCFCGNEVQCSLPSSCHLETDTLPVSLPWITSLQKYLSFSERSLPVSVAAGSIAHGLVAFNLLSVSTHAETSDFLFFQTLLLLALPLLQSISCLASRPVPAFLFHSSSFSILQASVFACQPPCDGEWHWF